MERKRPRERFDIQAAGGRERKRIGRGTTLSQPIKSAADGVVCQCRAVFSHSAAWLRLWGEVDECGEKPGTGLGRLFFFFFC